MKQPCPGGFERLHVPQVEEPTDDDQEDTGSREGRLLKHWHYARERDRALRTRKINRFFKDNGCVFCEICLFDFEKVYGPRGAMFAECHHVVPLHTSGDTTTKLEDLILLCSNCHRMIHRKSPWLTPDELRTLVEGKPSTKVLG